jgi:tetratricopeptide (TPR) repeat protein
MCFERKMWRQKSSVQSLSRLGTIHEHLGNHDQALEYHNKAIKAAEEINYDEGLYRPITHIGAFYRRQNDLKTALTYYQRALEICRRIGDNQGLIFALGNVGRTLSDYK